MQIQTPSLLLNLVRAWASVSAVEWRVSFIFLFKGLPVRHSISLEAFMAEAPSLLLSHASASPPTLPFSTPANADEVEDEDESRSWSRRQRQSQR